MSEKYVMKLRRIALICLVPTVLIIVIAFLGLRNVGGIRHAYHDGTASVSVGLSSVQAAETSNEEMESVTRNGTSESVLDRNGTRESVMDRNGTIMNTRNESAMDTRNGTRESVMDTRINDKVGYLVILEIPEQLTSAVRNFVQLYMINQLHWKLRTIEPYVLRSRLAFVPPTKEDYRSLPLLSTYYNQSHMLGNLKRCFHSDVKLNTFEDFLINASRSFIVLKFVTETGSNKDLWECPSSMKDKESLFNGHLQRVKEKAMAIHGPKYQFVGVYTLCVNSRPTRPFSMLRIMNYVTQWMMKESGNFNQPYTPQYTVVIPQWRSIKNVANDHFYYDPSFTSQNFTESCELRTLPHSSIITTAASKMVKNLSLPRPLIAVHVRSEQLAKVELQQHVRGFIARCLEKFPKVLQAVQKKHNLTRDHVVFTHDGSEYGSTSMTWGGRRNASQFIISKIAALGIRNVQYTPDNKTSVDVALAQFVETEFLVSANILVIVGFGSFQSNLIERFGTKATGGEEWYQICLRTPEEDHLPGLDL